jgi:hypothetical protein
MEDDKKIPNVTGTTGTKSIEIIQARKSGRQDPRSPSLTRATRRKRLYFLGVIALILVTAIPVIGYLRQSETAKRLEGLAIAICAIAWGGFLIRHFVKLVEEEDTVEEETRLQDQVLNENRATISPANSNIAQQTNPTTPPSDSG